MGAVRAIRTTVAVRGRALIITGVWNTSWIGWSWFEIVTFGAMVSRDMVEPLETRPCFPVRPASTELLKSPEILEECESWKSESWGGTGKGSGRE